MSRFAETFAHGKKALVTYLCVGDPDEKTSVEAAVACAEGGADILELGCPFSDPSADGPAIARASQRALARGGGMTETLRVARAVRERTPVPIVLFGYYNPLFVRGEESAIAAAKDAGIDALLVVDLPVDESTSLRALAAKHGLGVVPLVAPTSTDARIARIADVAKGGGVPFVYYVSMAGVTGGAGSKDVLTDAAENAARVRAATGVPTVVGFGIDSPERARIAATKSDGVVVGSALVRLLEEGKDAASIRTFVKELKAAM